MCNWRKWIWPGILAVAILTALSIWFRADFVEGDLSAKATNDLAAEHPWASVELDGRDLTLKGISPSEADTQSALRIADDAYDVRVAVDGTELVAATSPFIIRAEKNNGKITLSGNYPSESVKAKLSEAAKAAAPGFELVDEMTLARGAPEGFSDLAGFSLSQLSGLSAGAFELSDAKLAMSGVASGVDEYKQVITALDGTLPANGELVSRDIKPFEVSPYEWMADYDGAAVTLSGFAPNGDARAAIEAAVKSQLPEATVLNTMKVAGGAPGEFKTATDYAAGFFPLLSQGRVSYKDNAFSVSGVAKSSSEYVTANQKVEQIPTGYVLAENGIQPDGVSPFVWSAKNDGKMLTLDGFAPTIETRDGMIARAKGAFPDLTIVDNLKIAGGAPQTYDPSVSFSFDLLKNFTTGEISLWDTNLVVSGETADQQNYNAALSKVATGLEGTTIQAKIQPPVADPYRWSVSKLPTGVTVSGNVAEEADGLSAIEMVKSKLGVSEVTDKQVIASGKPEGLDEVRELIVSQVRYLEAGQGNIIGNNLSITGRAKNENIRNLIDRGLKKRAPQGYDASTNITFPKSKKILGTDVDFQEPVTQEVCQSAIIAAIDGRKIQFETARAVILPASQPLLKAVLTAAERCPDLKIMIAGHTDARGRDTYNQSLSEARAQAVLAYLVDAGMSANRLEAKGFGETSPIESNETVEGRTANRRIEFNVLK